MGWHNEVFVQVVGTNQLVGAQHADGQGEVVGRTLLADVGGGHVDGSGAGGQAIVVDRQGRAYALVALFHG